MIVVSSFIQCFDAIDCATEKTSSCKNLLRLSQEILFWVTRFNLAYFWESQTETGWVCYLLWCWMRC